MKYFEVSSKKYQNINEMFDSLNIDMLRAMQCVLDDISSTVHIILTLYYHFRFEDMAEVVRDAEPVPKANNESRCNVM